MPSAADLLNAALAEHRAGNLPQAEGLYRELLSAAPDSPDAWHLLGALCLQAGRGAEAVEAIGRAIALNPRQPEYYNHLGAAYSTVGQHTAAVESLRRAVRMMPQAAVAHYNLGTALRNAGQLEEAVSSFCHAIATNPSAAEAHYNLANTLRELKRYAEAETSYRDALRVSPRYLKAMINLGGVLGDQRRFDEAIDVLRAAVKLDPSYARAHLNLGSTLRDAGQFEEAVAVLETSVALDPQSAEGQNNLGTSWQALAQWDRAAACYEAALRLDPQLPDAHFSRGTWLLRQGDLAAGFAEYEWRWKCKSFSTRTFDRPRWDGSPLAGRTVLLHAEQGLGDTIQFARYAADVKDRGGRVVVECQPALVKLLSALACVDEIVAAGEALPDYDAHCPLISLPAALGLSIDELARPAGHWAEAKRIERWRAALADVPALRVGICWQGNPQHLFDRQRSFALARLAPLAQVPGMRLVSLQKGPGSDQRAGCSFDVIDLGEALDADGAFLDTAAVMQHLDLVITADTAIAHLAGAVGVKVWVALSAHSDWRWFADREDSPWYPTMRLFRQRQLDAWDEVFARIARELAAFAHEQTQNRC